VIFATKESVREVRPEHSGPTNSLTAPIGKPPCRTASTASTPVVAVGRIIFCAGVSAEGIFRESADSIWSRIAEAECKKVYLRFIFAFRPHPPSTRHSTVYGATLANSLIPFANIFFRGDAYNIGMCYSARVKQHFNHLSRRYGAEVDWEAFEDVFRRRAEGEDIKVSRDLQRNYQHPITDVQQRTAEYIAAYLRKRKSEWETEVFAQRRRLSAAQESLAKKETKKAREEIRIATSKSEALLERLADLRRTEPNNEDARIFPMMYAPVLIRQNDKTIIRPMRYACRLAGKPADYDKRFPGTYNARRDSLDDYWRNIYGHNHAVMVISGFYENVPLHLYEHRELAAEEKAKNLVLEFDPKPSRDMLVACLWDRWTSPDGPNLDSFAAITDEPTPEVAATGHQRTIITIQEQYLLEWLSPAGLAPQRLEEILTDKETPYFVHQIAA
jgi:putative SOS response-associated peptidase YedK